MKLNRRKFCECGCGLRVKNRFVSGHNGVLCKGKILSQKTKDKISKAKKGSIGYWNGKHHSLETRIKISKSHMGKKLSNIHRINVGLSLKGFKHSEQSRKNMSEAKKKQTQETRNKISKANKGRKYPLEFGKKISDSNKGRDSWNKGLIKCYTKETLEKMSIAKLNMSEEIRQKISNSVKRLWKDKEYITKICKGRAIRPNKPETIVLDLLNNFYPNEWRYTGDFSFMINGKNPDFVNCNGQKKIIELFGNYFHKGENPKDRAKIFAPFGYKTLVIWERELKNINKVKSRIQRFNIS